MGWVLRSLGLRVVGPKFGGGLGLMASDVGSKNYTVTCLLEEGGWGRGHPKP